MINEAAGKGLYAVPILDKYLVYAPLHHASALVNKPALSIIADCIKGKIHCNVYPDMESLIALLRKPTAPFILDIHKPIDPVFLGIIPSRRCTMSCEYCGFGSSSASAERMDPAMCIAAIDYLFDKTIQDSKRECRIQFFGGEPFIEDDIIDIAVHHARMLSERTGIRVTFEASTNGFYDESRARFVGEYIDITVLSLDGFQEFHDRNRPASQNKGSFDVVTRSARILSESSTDLCIRCCITRESVDSMVGMARWFCTEFKPSSISFETLQENDLSRDAGLFPPDPLVFANNYTLAARVIDTYGVQPVYGAIEGETPRHTFCPLGRDALICGPDNTINACYLQKSDRETKGMDLSVGYIERNGRVHIDESSVSRVRKYVADKPLCDGCFCRHSCAGGCHMQNTFPGALYNKNDFCRQTRIITACSLLSLLGLDQLADKVLGSKDALLAIAENPCDIIDEMVA